VLRLDTEEDRARAAKGKYFQITAVPTLAVIYADGNAQLFLGAEKVLQWMAETVSKMRQPAEAPQQPYRGVGTGPVKSTGGNMYGPGRPHPSQRHTRTVDYGEEDPDEYEDPEQPQEDDTDLEAPPAPPPRGPKFTQIPPKGGQAKAKSKAKVVVEDDDGDETPVPAPAPIIKKGKSKKKSKKGVKFAAADDSVQIQPEAPVTSVASQSKKKSSSRMQSVFEMAKKMESDRTKTLGYKEEELPHY
jgi:hypothetical protein